MADQCTMVWTSYVNTPVPPRRLTAGMSLRACESSTTTSTAIQPSSMRGEMVGLCSELRNGLN